MKIKGKHFWVFKIDGPVEVQTRILGVEFDNEWLRLIPDGTLTIKATPQHSFCWDGATPKFNVLDIIIGTPDGVVYPDTGKAKTYYGTLLHDALYQFAPRERITRKQADLVMLYEMRKTKFKPRLLYYFTIRMLGWIWWNKKKRH